MNSKQIGIWPIIVMGVWLGISSCHSKSLKDQRAQKEIEYILQPGAQVAVSGGIATFTGTFPSEESMRQAEETAKNIKSVKSVVNKATVAQQVQSAVDTQ